MLTVDSQAWRTRSLLWGGYAVGGHRRGTALAAGNNPERLTNEAPSLPSGSAAIEFHQNTSFRDIDFGTHSFDFEPARLPHNRWVLLDWSDDLSSKPSNIRPENWSESGRRRP
ncbi:hypothetical protein [Nocardia sp. CA-290969]|uniref:hypothetical protein n=1 Tax=Nocardia sp. CA-290969 TaxID=3239986 RepID=UPI003D936F4B